MRRPVGSDLGLTPPQMSQIPHLAIRFPTEPGEHWRQRFDVRQRGAEVDDARAERKPAADHRVRQKRLAAALDAREQLLIQPLQVRLDLRRRLCWPEVARNVSERRDAEMLGDRFEILVPLDEPCRDASRGACRRQSSGGTPSSRRGAAPATPSAPGTRESSAGRSRSSSSLRGRSGSSSDGKRRRPADRRGDAPARNRPRPERTATCADPPRPNRPH